ncbi:hypothetical protein BZA05DRAFT_407078 [Tricharina praecox]|uniref:uncharacterized protein n=1 Tax=Tricharina praecox TaxID=43433 RepID=UPI00222128F2|nr:uncharacterized protein BZA05DRAFT_407078 [Tricharina praecox]KAI5846149.1 hypothetical protein BZA05DRAFT_407078 [Tricharina praecox]
MCNVHSRCAGYFDALHTAPQRSFDRVLSDCRQIVPISYTPTLALQSTLHSIIRETSNPVFPAILAGGTEIPFCLLLLLLLFFFSFLFEREETHVDVNRKKKKKTTVQVTYSLSLWALWSLWTGTAHACILARPNPLCMVSLVPSTQVTQHES